MKLKYMPLNLNPTVISSNQCFIDPAGYRTLTPRKMTKDGKHNIEECIYEIDLYTANGMIEYNEVTRNMVIQLNQEQFLDLVIKNNMDFYAFWLSAIDKLIRYFGFTVKEAIQYQAFMSRKELYDKINEREQELFPIRYDKRVKYSP